MKMIKWHPNRRFINVDNNMHRMMDRFFSPEIHGNVSHHHWIPQLDVVENENEYLVALELPGLGKDDVTITLVENKLTIEGEKKQVEKTEDKQLHRVERRYGKFQRQIQLPDLVDQDKIDATFKDGILSITLPKSEKAKPKTISVKVS